MICSWNTIAIIRWISFWQERHPLPSRNVQKSKFDEGGFAGAYTECSNRKTVFCLLDRAGTGRVADTPKNARIELTRSNTNTALSKQNSMIRKCMQSGKSVSNLSRDSEYLLQKRSRLNTGER